MTCDFNSSLVYGRLWEERERKREREKTKKRRERRGKREERRKGKKKKTGAEEISQYFRKLTALPADPKFFLGTHMEPYSHLQFESIAI